MNKSEKEKLLERYKESLQDRKVRLEGKKLYTRIFKPKKGNGSYDRSNNKNF